MGDWHPTWSLLDLMGVASKSSFILLIALLGLALIRHQSAARRVLAAQMAFVALLTWPAISALLPSIAVQAPWAWSALSDAPLPLPEFPALAVVASPPPADGGWLAWFGAWPTLVVLVYGSVAGFLLLRIAINLARLQYLKQSARAFQPDPAQSQAIARWQSALLDMRARCGIARQVQLIVTGQAQTPISWGLVRPVIMVDMATVTSVAPDDVLQHELAHIDRWDWGTLTLARVLSSLYWFHPLAWMVLKNLQFDMEGATDDAVLRRGGVPSRYATTLIQVSQRTFGGESGANALAARGKTLASRIVAILEPAAPREPVGRFSWTVGVVLTLIVALPLGAVSWVGESNRWPTELFAQPENLSVDAGARAADALERLGNPNFSALAHAVRTGDFEQRHALAIESFRQRAAIAPLILALHDRQAQTRRLALWGLGEMQFAETAPVIAAMLRDADPHTRGEAARALAELDDATWVPHIMALLQDVHPRVRAQAAHALGDLAHRSSLSALQLAQSDADTGVAQEARWAVNEILGRPHD